MTPSLDNHFGKRTAWSLLHFLNYAYFDILPIRKFWESVSIFECFKFATSNQLIFFLVFLFIFGTILKKLLKEAKNVTKNQKKKFFSWSKARRLSDILIKDVIPFDIIIAVST